MSARAGDTIPYVVCTHDDPAVSYAMRAYHPDDVARAGSGLAVGTDTDARRDSGAGTSTASGVTPTVWLRWGRLVGGRPCGVQTWIGTFGSKYTRLLPACASRSRAPMRRRSPAAWAWTPANFPTAAPLRAPRSAATGCARCCRSRQMSSATPTPRRSRSHARRATSTAPCAIPSAHLHRRLHRHRARRWARYARSPQDQTTVVACTNASCRLPTPGASLGAQVNTAIRSDLQRYYDGWVVRFWPGGTAPVGSARAFLCERAAHASGARPRGGNAAHLGRGRRRHLVGVR